MKPTNEICPGCEYPFDFDDPVIIYFDENWHEKCAEEDKVYQACVDAGDKYRHEFDE